MPRLPHSTAEPATPAGGDIGTAHRAGLWPPARAAAGWGAAGAVSAGGAWAVGLVAARVFMGFAVPAASLDGQVFETAVVLAGICGGCGLVVGAVAGLLLGGADRAGAAVVWALGGTFTGVIGGGLSPPLVVAGGPQLPVEVGSGVAWSIAGLMAGLIGYGCRRRHSSLHDSLGTMSQPPHSTTEPTTPDWDDTDPTRRTNLWPATRAAAGWGLAGAVGVGGAWVLGLVTARRILGVEVQASLSRDEMIAAAAVLAAIGVACGLIVGTTSGLLSRNTDRTGTAARALIGALAGAAGGGLSPFVVVAVGGWLPVEVSSALSWALVGLLGGVVGNYRDRRRARQNVIAEEADWSDDESVEDQLPGLKRSRRPTIAPAPRLVPILAVSSACLAAVIATSPSSLGWPVLAIGLLGLAVAWALVGQERRIRELERQLRKRKDGA
ncbi:MAG: hypothetical protein JWO38_7151 [Gemmataceae bacterium]|nr:hypothetical protein [Gemmataceae bacterium]